MIQHKKYSCPFQFEINKGGQIWIIPGEAFILPVICSGGRHIGITMIGRIIIYLNPYLGIQVPIRYFEMQIMFKKTGRVD